MNRLTLALLVPCMIVGHAHQPAATRQHQSVRQGETTMKGSHVHLGVKDLAAALKWLDKVWQVRPTFQTERLATLPFGTMTLILDASATDTSATIGFESDDCDADFRTVADRGAVVLERPTDRPWGARSAYIKGPGALTFEIEQVLRR